MQCHLWDELQLSDALLNGLGIDVPYAGNGCFWAALGRTSSHHLSLSESWGVCR